MMRSILLLVNPEIAKDIVELKLTRLLRFSIPKNFIGWVNIYCSDVKPFLIHVDDRSRSWYETVCIYSLNFDGKLLEHLNGKIVARFWYDESTKYSYEAIIPHGYETVDGEWVDQSEYGYNIMYRDEELKKTCMTYEEVEILGRHRDLYAWHIKNLEVFNSSKRLNEFYTFKWKTVYSGIDCPPYADQVKIQITKPPIDWRYVYEEGSECK